METVERYTYNELLQLIDDDPPTINEAIKILGVGTRSAMVTTFRVHEINKLKLYLNRKDRLDYLKIIDYLDKHQPIKIYQLQSALEEEGLFFRCPVLLDTYTYKDGLLWEDKFGNLWYGFDEWFEENNLFRIAEEFSGSHWVESQSIWF